jgi:hypothetical protein
MRDVTFFVLETLEYYVVVNLNLGGFGGLWACFLVTSFGDHVVFCVVFFGIFSTSCTPYSLDLL